MKQTSTTNNHTTWYDLLGLSTLLSIIYTLWLGARGFAVPDSARYVEIPREMLSRGDFVTPHLNGVLYFEKPPLFYWLQAFAIKTFGLHEWAMRLWPVIFALLGCVACYLTARALYSRRAAIFSSLILGTSLLYFTMAHLITLDMPVTIFLTFSLCAFIAGEPLPMGWHRRGVFWLAYASAACAVLTKGLIGLVFPLMVIGLWILLLNQWRVLLKMYLPTGLLIFAAISVPWHLLIQHRHPAFFHFYFIDQHFLRFATLNANRYQPFWFFLPILIVGLFPWSVFLLQALWQSLTEVWNKHALKKAHAFLLIWGISIFVFYSFSHSKLIPYILPVLPPFALLLGHYFDTAYQQEFQTRGLRYGLIGFVILALLCSTLLYNLPSHLSVEQALTATGLLRSLAAILIVSSLLTCILLFKRHCQRALLTILITIIPFLILFHVTLGYVDNRPIKSLALTVKPLLKSSDEVVSYGTYFQDLPVYLQRRVSVVGWRNELTFGMQHQDTRAWMIDHKTFWKRWNSSQHVFVFLHKETLHDLRVKHPTFHFCKLTENQRSLVIRNHC